MNRLRERLASAAVILAERQAMPDRVIRAGMRHVIGSRLSSLHRHQGSPTHEVAGRHGVIAEETLTANRQHYEVSPDFFEAVLGPNLKYSCAWWPPGVDDLSEAEEAMLELYAERALLGNGQTILDLGCGWGSFSLWAAQRYPNSSVLAVSNSQAQGDYIEKRAAHLGLDNVQVETADINSFDPDRQFDRIVSIEMLEHVRDHRLLFSRAEAWMTPGGVMFTHVFAHQRYAYTYEPDGPANWMARTFFAGGVMPSRSLLPGTAAPAFDLDDEWWIPGDHYHRTCEAWLGRLDASRPRVEQLLVPVYGADLVAVWVQRWRMFFMACAELFAYDQGRQWGVVHQRFRPTRAM